MMSQVLLANKAVISFNKTTMNLHMSLTLAIASAGMKNWKVKTTFFRD